MTRTNARRIAVQLGFAVVSTGQEPEEALAEFFAPEHYGSLVAESSVYEARPEEKELDFIRASVQGVYDYRIELDHIISAHAAGWRAERISRAAAAVLRQAIFEILYMPEIPAASSINEAVEIARDYEDEDVVAFVNGVLGGFYRAHTGEMPPPEAPAETAADE